MTITCDNCKQSNKGRYSSFFFEGKIMTLCDDCRWGPRPVKSEEAIFNELQTPFWKLMGQKPKEKDVALDKYLKHRGISYGEWRRERIALEAKHPSAINEFDRHYRKYGPNNTPDSAFNKNR